MRGAGTVARIDRIEVCKRVSYLKINKDENEDDARAAEEDMVPDEQVCTAEDDESFCYTVTTDNDGNVIYSDLAGRFPISRIIHRYELFLCMVCLQMQLYYG